jgi:hypothetical protein
MIDRPDAILAVLRQSEPPALPTQLRSRALAIARTNLVPPKKTRRSRRFAEYTPPPSLVPYLLISAGVVFVFDAFLRIAHVLWMS